MSDKQEQIINFYEILPKELNGSKRNPREKYHGMRAIFRALLIGPSGSGKSNSLLNLIHAYRGTFDKIILCTKNADEPLYNYMKERLQDDLEIYENINTLPPLEEFSNLYGKKSQILVIFDDMILANPQEMKRIEEYYIRCRKICGGVSVIFLSQSYFRIPKMIRSNANYCIIKKITSKKDLKLILAEYNLTQSIEELTRIYERCTASITDFLLIDVDESPEKRLRHNFTVLNSQGQ